MEESLHVTWFPSQQLLPLADKFVPASVFASPVGAERTGRISLIRS
jgi:hypothetical protein